MKTSRREEIPFSLIVRVDFLGFRAPLGPATRSRENTRHDRLEDGWIVQGPTRRIGRSSNDRYAWLFPLFLPTLKRREGHEARRRARLTWPSFLPSLLHERLSYASPESGAATTPRSPPTFQPVHRGTPRDLTLTINADENSNNNNNKLIAMEIDQVWWTS